MSSHSDMSVNATRVFDILIQFLCVEHIDYALDLGLQGTYKTFFVSIHSKINWELESFAQHLLKDISWMELGKIKKKHNTVISHV